MPLTTLDPISALIIIDLQKGVVSLPTVHPAAEIVARAAQLAAAFRQHGLPVVLVNVSSGAPGRTDAGPPSFSRPADWAELVPELEAHEQDHRVTKWQWGAFHGTSLDHYLRRRGVTQVVLAGISTSIGVESTARSAHDLGYNVVLVTDAMTDRNADAHRNSIGAIFPRLGECTDSAAVLAQLAKRN